MQVQQGTMRRRLVAAAAGMATLAGLIAAGQAQGTEAALGFVPPAGSTLTQFDQHGWFDAGPDAFLTAAGFDGPHLRTNGVGNLDLRLDDLPHHTGIAIGFHVAQIGSLDPRRDGDRFRVTLDGTEMLDVGLGFGTAQGYNEPLVQNLEVFGAPTSESVVLDTLTATSTHGFPWHAYDLSQVTAFQEIPHTGSSLSLSFWGKGNQGASNESYGIDNLVITLLGTNQAPVVDAGDDVGITYGDSVVLDASFADEGDEGPWSIDVDWGDGTNDTVATAAPGATAPSHRYTELGDHTVEICVTDPAGAIACDEMTVAMDDLYARKQAARDELDGIGPTLGDKDAKRVAKALEDLDQSLDPDLWVDGNHLDPTHGERVLKEERQSVKDLEKVEGADMRALISELVEIDRTLALIAIDEATAALADSGGDAKELDKASKDLGKAREHMADGDLEDDADRAIHDYRKAWDHAAKAAEHIAKA